MPRKDSVLLRQEGPAWKGIEAMHPPLTNVSDRCSVLRHVHCRPANTDSLPVLSHGGTVKIQSYDGKVQ